MVSIGIFGSFYFLQRTPIVAPVSVRSSFAVLGFLVSYDAIFNSYFISTKESLTISDLGERGCPIVMSSTHFSSNSSVQGTG